MAKKTLAINEVLKDIGFNETEIAELAPKFTAERTSKLADGYMRQDDYSRAMDEGRADITAKQQALDEANQRLNVEMAEWATVQANGGKVTEKMRADLEAAQAAALKARQVIERMGTTHGIDVTQALSEVTQVTPVTIQPTGSTAAAPDLSGYVKVEDVNRMTGELANLALNIAPELMTIAGEHQALYGTPLDARTITAEIQKRAGTRGNQKSLNPRQVWEELHNVAQKRQEVETARIDKLVADAKAAGREEALSNISIPGNTSVPGRHSSPVLGANRQSALNRPQPGTTVSTAAAAFRSGKYRSGEKVT